MCLTLCNAMDPPWTCQAPLSLEFSRQEYWNGLPCPPPDLWQDLVRSSEKLPRFLMFLTTSLVFLQA
ncbi:unnamed protein product, partial [Rangifer tarandus platyrhynchus]